MRLGLAAALLLLSGCSGQTADVVTPIDEPKPDLGGLNITVTPVELVLVEGGEKIDHVVYRTAGHIVAEAANPALGPLDTENATFRFPVRPDASSVVVELSWQAQADQDLDLALMGPGECQDRYPVLDGALRCGASRIHGDGGEAFWWDRDGYPTSPDSGRVEVTQSDIVRFACPSYGPDCLWRAEAWAITPVANADFEMAVTVFYAGEPSPDYSGL